MKNVPEPPITGAPRLDALTGIRFVAAIAVFNAHVIPPVNAPTVVGSFSLAGHDWMTMFFILSGLVLVWNYDAALGDALTARELRTYYIARLARIYPLYLLTLAIAVAPAIRSIPDLSALAARPDLWIHVFALQSWSGNLAFRCSCLRCVAYAIAPAFLLRLRLQQCWLRHPSPLR